MTLADHGDRPSPVHNILGRVAVVVTGTGGRHRLREQPAVEDAGCDDAVSALRGGSSSSSAGCPRSA